MSNLAITYLGHASTIIQSDGLNIYTDPHFGTKALLIKRRRPVPQAPETLPRPDAILISHAHYDHLDFHTFKYFSSDVPVILPPGLAQFVGRFIRNPLIELSPGAEIILKDRIQLRAIPVKHQSGRISHLRYRESTGYLLQGEAGPVFFPGDTAYDECLLAAKAFGPVTAALLPVGPCRPRSFMRKRHLMPEQVLQLAEKLEARALIPIHWGVFRLGLEKEDTALHEFKNCLTESPLKEITQILEPGMKWTT